jgi:hypothetical protein
MSPKYAKDQPASFANCIEKVAIVGVSESYLEPQPSVSRFQGGPADKRIRQVDILVATSSASF